MIDVEDYDAFLFDLDGVLTRTAEQHFQAWKETFDRVLRDHGRDERFDENAYQRHVDGMSRIEGARRFANAVGLDLDEGSEDDPASRDTVHGVAARKNERVNELIREQGVIVYPDAVALVRHVRALGRRTAVVSASRNCETVVTVAGIADLFDARVDGVTAAELRLAGKPAPDMFLRAAEMLDTTPGRCVVLEDALAGVEAGRAGGFGLVVGVDRVGQAPALSAHGAELVVADLAGLIS